MILPREQDPLGAAIKDYYEGKLKAAIKVASDRAVDDVLPAYYLFRSLEEMPDWEKTALDECKGHVLDAGAGAGSHSLVLQSRGYEVTALDISLQATEVMRMRGIKNVIAGDIFSLPQSSYDTILLMMNGIGLVGDLDGLNAFLIAAKRLLAPGGRILLDSSDLVFIYREAGLSAPDTGEYYGVVTYTMSYAGISGTPFKWLFVDYPRLRRHALAAGYTCDLLMEGPHYEYLASLTLVA